jgi:tetratricopeptide (TPR) repeat protein
LSKKGSHFLMNIIAQIDRAASHLGAGNPAKALCQVAGFSHAVTSNPRECVIIGLIHLAADEKDKALGWFERALSLDPNLGEAAFHHGLILQDLGRMELALSAYEQALATGYSDPAIHYNRGLILRHLQRLDEAIAAFDNALRLKPDYPQALQAGGEILSTAGQFEAALQFFREALRLQPDFVPAAIACGNLLQGLQRPEAALETFEAALAYAPKHAGLLTNRGVVLQHLGRYAAALLSLADAIASDPHLPQAYFNRGNVFLRIGEPVQALINFDQALLLRTDYVEALCSRAVALKDLGRRDEAMAAYDSVLAQNPALSYVRSNRAALLLALGNYAEGFEDYEFRWVAQDSDPPSADLPLWDGQLTRGRRVLVFDEQGLGDAIQFVRYLGCFAEAGMEVTFLCRRQLHRLFKGLNPPIEMIDALPATEDLAAKALAKKWDCQIALSSLPRLFKTTLASLATQEFDKAYLNPEAALVTKWADYLGPKTQDLKSQDLRVGLCWHGSANIKADPLRSIPLSAFAPLTRLQNIRFISLQKYDGAAELAAPPAGLKIDALGDFFDAGEDSFIDTAAVMQSLDLIITCDTSIAHLAGALGCPVWVALRKVPDWRWLFDREDSPWYQSMRLFRQKENGNWPEVFEHVALALTYLQPLHG